MFKQLLLITASFAVIACGSDKKKTYQPADDNFVDPVAIQPAKPKDMTAPPGAQPLSITPSNLPQGMQMPGTPGAPGTPQPVAATAPGMNPPHGQPGHRCDIAVGAPLASAPPMTVVPPDAPKSTAGPQGEVVPPPPPVITTPAGEIKAVQIPAPENIPLPDAGATKKDSLNR